MKARIGLKKRAALTFSFGGYLSKILSTALPIFFVFASDLDKLLIGYLL